VNETETFFDEYLANGSIDPFFTFAAVGAVGAVHAPHSTPIHISMFFEIDELGGYLVSMIGERGLAEDTNHLCIWQWRGQDKCQLPAW